MKNVRNFAFYFLVWTLSAVFFAVMALILWDVSGRGDNIFNLEFITGSVERAGREGGIYPIIISTGWITLIAILVTVVIGLPTAMLLAHIRYRSTFWVKSIRTSLEVLATVPSVVFGLFGHLLFVKIFGFGYSILAGALTLSLMCLPYFTRLVEDGMRRVPIEHWAAAEALSLSYYTFALRIMLRLQRPVLATALTLSFSRALSETAALMFTSGYSTRIPESIFESGRTLSVHIMDLALNVAGGDSNAFRTAFLLLVITFLFQLLARGIFLWLPQTKAL